MIEVKDDKARLEQFLSLPQQVYSGDPNYCRIATRQVTESLNRAGFHGRQRILVALENGHCVARVVARRSPALADETGRQVGMLGFFEALDRSQVVSQLLSTAVDWLQQSDVGLIVGPMDGDTWHRYRLNVGPFDHPPFLMEPYNPPYYPALWEDAGFEQLEGYYSKQIDNVAQAAPELEGELERVLSSGYKLRPIDPDRFEEELGILYRLSIDIFADNFLYEEIVWEDFLSLYRPVKSLVDAQLVWFAQSPQDEYVGFVFAVRDYHRAIVAMCGGRGLLAKVRFLLHRHQAQAINIKSLGVIKEHRKSGVGAALMCRVFNTSVELGYKKVNLCLIRHGNPSGRIDGGKGVVSRRYTLYRYVGEGD